MTRTGSSERAATCSSPDRRTRICSTSTCCCGHSSVAGAPMVADPILFRDLAYVFVAAMLGGGLAWLARQPLILGYVAGGLLVSPWTPGPSVSDVHTFELFAEIGVVLLMFSIGIEFSLKDLMRVKWGALGGGPLGILLSTGLGLGSASSSAGGRSRERWWGWSC